ncbi:MAG: 30S ribosomal protein S20 [Desulfobacteraceae bacterium]|nr:MAG: 30S ribosomal protein S20 [Desulfobacteraceae bacterium]
MANHKSAKKRAKQSLVRRQRNRSVKTSIKNLEKKVRTAVQEGDENTAAIMQTVQSGLHKAAKKGVIHHKTASRKISRLTRLVNA